MERPTLSFGPELPALVIDHYQHVRISEPNPELVERSTS
jgi:hypothetical protein